MSLTLHAGAVSRRVALLIVCPLLQVKGSGPCGADVQQPCRLNYEAEVSHKVTVMVTDSGTPRKHATFDLDIEVTDANDPPYNMQLSGKFCLSDCLRFLLVRLLEMNDVSSVVNSACQTA